MKNKLKILLKKTSVSYLSVQHFLLQLQLALFLSISPRNQNAYKRNNIRAIMVLILFIFKIGV
ncbi:hypothetical protein AC231_08975 [Clostridium pasteurianum]|nr:hypothetical protein AC231_08975 [Clostridium pasteurianum]